MSGHEYGTTESVVKARKPHLCEGYRCGSGRLISKGDLYTRSVCFPGHDANGGTRPWVLKLCSDCKPLMANAS